MRETSSPRPRIPALLALFLAGLTACEVEWGGARMALEQPSPPEGEAPPSASEAAAETPPLPDGPLLLLARLDPDGEGLALPVARVSPRGLRPLQWPRDPPAAWRERFVSTFQPPGAELPLHARGVRVGTLILEGGRDPVNAGCPAPSAVRALLPPDHPAPRFAFAFSPRGDAPSPDPPPPPELTRRIRTFAPILAERLLREAGVERSFLARRAALEAVPFPGDTAPGMAAAYLINDTLAAAPSPPGPSASLFFLARYDPARGYVPVWAAVRSYTDPGGKEAFEYVGILPAPTVAAAERRASPASRSPSGGEGDAEEGEDGGALLFLRQVDASSERLAAVALGAGDAGPGAGEDGEGAFPAVTGAEAASAAPRWVEARPCSGMGLLGEAPPRPAASAAERERTPP